MNAGRQDGTAFLETVRARAEQFFQELEREYYLEGAGLKERIDTGAIYAKYPDLASRTLLGQLEGLLNDVRLAPAWSEEADTRRRLEMLREMTVQTYLANTARQYSDEALNREAEGIIALEAEGERIPYRTSAISLLNENDRSRRRSIALARDQFTASTLNPILGEMWTVEQENTRNLGYPSYTGMVRAVSGIDFEGLAADAGLFLSGTDDMYAEVLEWFARKHLGCSVNDLEKHDLAYLGRRNKFDRYFPASRMTDNILTFVRGMGIEPDGGGRIRLDLETRERKSPRAFCSPVRIPNEVYLVIRPAGGADDYEAFLHELGHALHFAHMNEGLAWEYRRLGDNSVTEGFAILFDHLVMNGRWLGSVLGFEHYEDFARHAHLIKLMMVRRYAAKFSYEMSLWEGPTLAGKEEEYRDRLTSATRARYSEADYLNDVDPFFYCVRYLRAWMLESLLSRHLVENFNEDWFRNPATGAFFKELWSEGQRYRAEELARQLAYPLLTLERVKNDLESILGR